MWYMVYGIYLGLRVAPISLFWGPSMYYKETWVRVQRPHSVGYLDPWGLCCRVKLRYHYGSMADKTCMV